MGARADGGLQERAWRAAGACGGEAGENRGAEQPPDGPRLENEHGDSARSAGGTGAGHRRAHFASARRGVDRQVMSKLANPWKCDNASCGILRANDTNHWLLAGVTVNPDGSKYLVISPWNDASAEQPTVKHACGIDCGLKVAAQLIDEHFFKSELSSAGK